MSKLVSQSNDNASMGPLEMESKSKTMMIAGGTDGIGFALLASELQRSKYSKIYVLGRDFAKVDQLLEQRERKILREPQQKIVKLPCDIRQLYEIGMTLAKLEENSIHDFVLTIGSFHRGEISDIKTSAIEEYEDDKKHDDVVADHFHLNCIATIHLIRLIVPRLVRGDSQILVCTASLAIVARSPYALQSATKAALRSFIDTLRIELKGRTRVMNLMPPSVDTKIFAKAGDCRNTDGYPPPSRIANTIQYMLDCPPDICIPEILIEQHHFDVGHE
jgi:short-subunit dehydrogenase